MPSMASTIPRGSSVPGDREFKVSGSGDSGGPLFIYNKNNSRIEYLGTVSGGGIYDKDGAVRNFTRFVYSNYIADWVEQTISDNEATSETEEEGA